MRKRVVRVLTVTVAVVVVLSLMAWMFQRHLIYFPDTDSPQLWQAPAETSQVRLTTSDGIDLDGWLVAPSHNDRDTAVAVYNGNGGNRAARSGLAANLATEGFTVLLFDYRGYGGNSGKPHEEGLYADGAAALDYLTTRAGFDAERVLLFGESLGAGVASRLATKHETAGLILRSPFSTLADVGAAAFPFLPVRTLLTERYPVIDNVTEITVPMAVVYGTADSIVPPDQSVAVASAARDAGVEVRVSSVDADHNDVSLVEGEDTVAAAVAVADAAGL